MIKATIYAVFCCFAVLLVVTACDTGAPSPSVPLTVQPAPATPLPPLLATPMPPVYRPTINITEKDYQAHLARWRRQGITEYEITMSEISLRSTNGYPQVMHVTGNTIALLLDPRDPTATQFVRTGADIDKAYKDYTVDGLLETVADWLANAAPGHATTASLPMVYQVAFDANLGYPSYLEQACVEPGPSPPYVCPTDTFVEQRITNLTVFKRTLPGTPPVATPNSP